MRMRLPLLTALLALGLLGVNSPADDQPPTKPPSSGSQLKVPDGTPAEILQFLNQSMRKAKTVEDFNVLAAAADKAVDHTQATDKIRENARMAKLAVLLQASMQYPDAFDAKFDAYTAQLIKEHAGTDLAGNAGGYAWMKKNFDLKQRAFHDKVDVNGLMELAKAHPKNAMVGQFFTMYAQSMEDDKEAAALLKKGTELFAGSPIAKQIEGELKAREVIGSELDLVGPTLTGGSFDVKSLKGRVVLVDYWATWCGPCVGELPNVQKVYAKYHDKGFEIVGISLDRSREPLEKFVKEKNMPWVQIIFKEDKDMFWNNPLAKKYGINAIPATFLIGRDGKVIGRNLRGEKLEKAVAKQFASGDRSEAPPTK